MTRQYAVLLAFLAVLSACDTGAPVQPQIARDTAAPRVSVQMHDNDGDGLKQFRLSWYDADGPLLNPPLRVQTLQPLKGGAAPGNLLDVWSTVLRDDIYLEVEETVDHLMRVGENRLVMTVTDASGKTGTDTVGFYLDPAVHHAHIELAREWPWEIHGCNDGRMYVMDMDAIVVIDPVTYALTRVEEEFAVYQGIACARDETAIYLSNGPRRFDLQSKTWTVTDNELPDGLAITQSRMDSDVFLIGTGTPARLLAYNRKTQTVVDSIPLFVDRQNAAVSAIAVAGTRVYAALRNEGIAVHDFRQGWIVRWWDPARDLAVAGDEALLAAGDGLHLIVIRLSDGYPVSEYMRGIRAYAVAASPDGKRAVVTGLVDRDPARLGVHMIDVATLNTISEFRLSGAEMALDVAYHMDNKRVFVLWRSPKPPYARIDVYLDRN